MTTKINYLISLISACYITSSFAANEVVVYSARKAHLIEPMFQKFTEETGIKVKFQTGEAPELMQKIKAEGTNSPADLFMTVDVGNLWQASNEGLLENINSENLSKSIPAHLRDPNGTWYGLSMRARTIIFNPEKVKSEEIVSYENLSDKKWNKKICLRTSKKVYNQSLVAMMIAHKGEEQTKQTLKGWVNNLAAPVFSSDTDVIKAVESGLCDVGIINTYYFGKYQKDTPKTKLKLFWPNQKDQGVHINISGAGLLKNAKSKNEAIKLLEWLASEKAQGMFAGLNMEYPVNSKVEPVDLVKAWGTFKSDQMNLINAGINQTKAIKLMDDAGYL